MDEQVKISDLTVGELVALIRETVREELHTAEKSQKDAPQHEKLKALMESWAQESDHKPDSWWAEFDDSLNQNRFRLRTDET